MKKSITKNKYLFISCAEVVVFFVVWETVARLLSVEIILPTFSAVILAFFTLFTKPSFYLAVLFTLVRCLIGYVIGFTFGVVCGIIGAKYKAFSAIIAPISSILRAVPVAAVTLVLTLLIGSDILPSVIGVILVFPIIYQQIKTATENIDSEIGDVLIDVGAPFSVAFRTVYLPLVLPYTLSGISTTFGMNIKAVVTAEVLAYTVNSIGYKIYFAKQNFVEETPTLFAWVIVAVLLSVVFEYVLRLVAQRITRNISWI